MRVSVIIPSYNGVNKISNLLRALEKQSVSPDEVIIVIDGSTDRTLEHLQAATYNFNKIKILNQPNSGRSRARNNGAKEAFGYLLIFFDDDVIPVEDCILNHINHHKSSPNTILTGGLSEDESRCENDIMLYRSHLDKKWSSPLLALLGKRLSKKNIFISAANFSVSSDAFIKLGGFDESLKDVEDYDLALRAYESEIFLYYNHNAFAWHNNPSTCASYIKRQRLYRKSMSQLEKSKPSLISKYPLRKTASRTILKTVVHKFFAKKFWILCVDHFNWLKVFPKKIRYKLYGLIIEANGIYYPNKVKL